MFLCASKFWTRNALTHTLTIVRPFRNMWCTLQVVASLFFGLYNPPPIEMHNSVLSGLSTCHLSLITSINSLTKGISMIPCRLSLWRKSFQRDTWTLRESSLFESVQSVSPINQYVLIKLSHNIPPVFTLDDGCEFKGYYRLRVNLYDDLMDVNITSERHFDSKRCELTDVNLLDDGKVQCFIRKQVRSFSCNKFIAYLQAVIGTWQA